jgi:hypothetical protein
MTNYITKNFRADLVLVHNLSDGLPPMGMWNEMQLHLDRYRAKFVRRPIDRPGIMLVLSPSAEESMGWGEKEWRDFCWEFIREMDKVDEVYYKGKLHKVKPTNLANTQLFAGLHRDSKSGILHLHLLGNRIDLLGNINDAHFIGQRAMKAAAIINQRRGWKDPMAIREEHIRQIIGDCMDILCKMPEFHWWTYEAELRKRGYEVKLNRDSMDEVRGYTIMMGNSSYKASELGTDRRLLASRLYRTWVMLHKEQEEQKTKEIRQPAQPKQDGKSPIIPVSLPEKKDEDYVEYSVKPEPKEPLETTVPQSVKPVEQEMYHDSFCVGGKDYDLAIPMSAYQVMRDAVEVADGAAQTTNDVLRMAMLLFLNYVDAATTMAESVGGGGGVESGWGRKKDDDDEWWARRCAHKAVWLCKPMRKSYKR